MQKLSQSFFDCQQRFGDAQKDMGVFFENHDNPRFLSEHNDKKRYENAITLT